jgi:phospholipid/cholesterol/gamma-HCH transport system permease protein
LNRLLGSVGKKTLNTLRHFTSITVLSGQAFYWFLIAPFKKRVFVKSDALVYQMVEIGVNSFPIVALVSFFLGLVLAMQTAYQLKQVGAEMYVGSLIGVSMTREIGPLITAIVAAARVGASITAELGTMKVSEEIEALETMGLNPVRFLILPRLMAILIMLPCLTIFSDIVGIIGGYVIGVFSVGIEPSLYISKMVNAMALKDIATGLIKSVSFAFIICLIACYQGFIVKGGAEGVGRSTTSSVVISIISVIAADVFFTALFYFVFP